MAGGPSIPVTSTGPIQRAPTSTRSLRDRLEKDETNTKRIQANRRPQPTLLHQLSNAKPMSKVADGQTLVYNKATGTYIPVDLPSGFVPYASLTGAGETNVHGLLTQSGPFAINDSTGTGIALSTNGPVTVGSGSAGATFGSTGGNAELTGNTVILQGSVIKENMSSQWGVFGSSFSSVTPILSVAHGTGTQYALNADAFTITLFASSSAQLVTTGTGTGKIQTQDSLVTLLATNPSGDPAQLLATTSPPGLTDYGGIRLGTGTGNVLQEANFIIVDSAATLPLVASDATYAFVKNGGPPFIYFGDSSGWVAVA